MFWYPMYGKTRVNDALMSEWGRLFANWNQVQPDPEAKGFPDVGTENPELVRLGIKHFLEGLRLVGMAVTESPEVSAWQRQHAR